MRVLRDWIEDPRVHTILVDACGVLYTDKGPVPGAAEAVRLIQDYGKSLIVVTNNGGRSLADIRQFLREYGFDVPAIISAGCGLHRHPLCRAYIDQKCVYVVGFSSSHAYVECAGGQVVDDIADAQAVVMSASMEDDMGTICDHVGAFLSEHSDVPFICINPDRYIAHSVHGQYPVAGFFAQQISQNYAVPVVWMGKPYESFSDVVQGYLLDWGIQIDSGVVFFDDNLNNVDAMIMHLGIQGVCVTDTGLWQYESASNMSCNVINKFYLT